MRIVRYLNSSHEPEYGSQQSDGSVRRIEGEIFGEFSVTDETVVPRKLLAPIQPTAFLCIGINYRLHVQETGAKLPEFPVLFMKSTTALNHPGDPILLPRYLRSNEVDFEGELAVVIGKNGKNISRAKALDHVLGYTIGNDVSARDWQKKFGGGQFCRGKTFDTFAPLGPALVTKEEIPDPNQLNLRTLLNGEVMQDSNTRNMIFDIPALIEFLSGSTTLMAGTVILTGTPSGVGMARDPQVWLKPGDEIAIEIDGIGRLSNPVVEEA
ncbi:MAG TPA: fumarylacetoacetate hydrolase family protein [Chthoniobacterales bacterium]